MRLLYQSTKNVIVGCFIVVVALIGFNAYHINQAAEILSRNAVLHTQLVNAVNSLLKTHRKPEPPPEAEHDHPEIEHTDG